MRPSRHHHLSVCILAALAASGCASVRNAREAQDPARAPLGERTATARELGLPSAGEIRLAEVERAALRAQPLIVQARRDLEAAEARVSEVEGAYWPEISAGPVQYRYETSNSGAGASSNDGRSFYAFGFQVSWLLFDFGKTPAIVRQAAKQALAAQESLRTTEIDVLFQARQAFFNLLKQRELLKVADETLRQFEARLEQVKAFVRVGTRVPYDETKAEVDVGNARLTRVQTADAVRTAGATLASALGLAELTDWTPVEPKELPPFDMTFERAVEFARSNQPRIAAALALEGAASALVDAQIASLYPSIAFSAGYSASGLTFPLVWNWQLGPSLSWLLFNGFTNYYTIDEAAANLRAVRAQRALTEQQVWLDVRTNYIALEDAKERLDVTALIVRSAEENMRLAQGRHDVGIGSALDVTDAVVSLAQARADQVQARADYETALAELWRALGLMYWTGSR